MLVRVPSTVNILQRVELLSLKLIKQGYVAPKVKYLWPKEKGQEDKQRSTKHTHGIKNRIIRPPLKAGMNSGAPER
jgi:hypothetical protein